MDNTMNTRTFGLEEVVCESDEYEIQTVVGGGESGKWKSGDHLHRRLFLEVWL